MMKNKMEWAYESMACFLMEEYQMPGVEDAFTQGSYCETIYGQIWDAYGRVRERLGGVDEDKDIEIMIQGFEEVQRELCYRMYRYGAMFGE